ASDPQFPQRDQRRKYNPRTTAWRSCRIEALQGTLPCDTQAAFADADRAHSPRSLCVSGGRWLPEIPQAPHLGTVPLRPASATRLCSPRTARSWLHQQALDVSLRELPVHPDRFHVSRNRRLPTPASATRPRGDHPSGSIFPDFLRAARQTTDTIRQL